MNDKLPCMQSLSDRLMRRALTSPIVALRFRVRQDTVDLPCRVGYSMQLSATRGLEDDKNETVAFAMFQQTVAAVRVVSNGSVLEDR